MSGVEPLFAIGSFAHAGLWEEGAPVWSPLHRLKNYFEELPLGKIEGKLEEGVYLKNREKISIGEGTVVEAGAYIEGPCWVGKGCVIRHGAYLRAYTLIGDKCSIGHCAEIKHSILLDRAAATHFVYVGDSILGHSVNLGAGVKCANVRLDRREVSVSIENVRTRTGLLKMGALIGDRSQIGCNCVLNPGTIVGADSISYPLINLGGYYPSRSRIQPTGTQKMVKLRL